MTITSKVGTHNSNIEEAEVRENVALLLAKWRRESDVLYREPLECVDCTRPCEGVAPLMLLSYRYTYVCMCIYIYIYIYIYTHVYLYDNNIKSGDTQ